MTIRFMTNSDENSANLGENLNLILVKGPSIIISVFTCIHTYWRGGKLMYDENMKYS